MNSAHGLNYQKGNKMNRIAFIIAFLVNLFSIECYSENKIFSLSERSEEYSIRYLYHQNFPDPIKKDTIVFIDKELPESFVIELRGLKNGEKTVLIYNDNQELTISRRNSVYHIYNMSAEKSVGTSTKLSLYFVNGKLIVYSDDERISTQELYINPQKRIGVKIQKDGSSICHYLGCYELCEFKEMDYGKILDTGVFRRTKGLSSQGVDKDYSLRLPQDTVCNSPHSIRFEFRFEDSKMVGKSKTQRGRSEIAGVHSSSLMGKWIIEFDILVPKDTNDDQKFRESITQLHEGSMDAISPAFHIGLWKGELYCRLRGDSIPIGMWEKRNVPVNGSPVTRLGRITKGEWHHVKIFLREAYQRSLNPLTVIWVDSVKVFESNHPNCYNYEPRRKNLYNYIKFGIYKSSWLKLKACRTETARRIYYFDNYKVKY